MLTNPLLSGDPDLGGPFYGSTDSSTMGSPINSGHALMDDYGLTGGSPQASVSVGTGRANVYVGITVLAALVGMIAFHYGGFDAHLFVGRR